MDYNAHFEIGYVGTYVRNIEVSRGLLVASSP